MLFPLILFIGWGGFANTATQWLQTKINHECHKLDSRKCRFQIPPPSETGAISQSARKRRLQASHLDLYEKR